ncbi:tryptophan--tRNA ligase [Thermodesulforhabdus norvegica]|uniref:Tryptophan--tRNA ligase n=1 Tax=Thermodesulforhabdus norvegica TaxID=39841 RepID=A0A1I4UAQ2_9BACT|nr:tryptophan--tRNA ligase [Thermodesulforhabdus norvegica]SFM85803.1 tryptophanyl-tRNA synthetase [Thermodesulforhabdus norvegica]
MEQARKRVLSGMRPTGKLHLGNLHGALDNWLSLQDEYECFFFIADWHALTTDYASPEMIRRNTWDVVLDWLSAGIDPEKSTLFIQSEVKEHAELHVLLSMITPIPWLERNPTYKEQQQQLSHKDLSTYGFLGYPVLQTADIIIYRAHGVPVGKDQLPHIELAREIVRRFHFLYRCNIFPEPQALLTEYPVIPGTDGRKMSKSYNNCIYLAEDAESVRRKVMTMITDPQRKRRTDPGDPEVCPVFDLHRIYSGEDERSEIIQGCRTASIGCVDCKKILLKNLERKHEPIRERRRKFEGKMPEVYEIMEEGIKKAREEASRTMELVRDAMGMNPFMEAEAHIRAGAR